MRLLVVVCLLVAALVSVCCSVCRDSHHNCNYWMRIGECRRNPAYMNMFCQRSCGACQLSARGYSGCRDNNYYCDGWMRKGECRRNPGYMNIYCRLSCRKCSPTKPKSSVTSWGEWTKCTKSCGKGIQERTRECKNGPCKVNLKESRHCNTKSCPTVTTWGDWTECTKSCGGGVQQRTRKCMNGPCKVDLTEKQSCNRDNCPIVTDWGPWSKCSKSCGMGVQQRTRMCIIGPCEGKIDLEEEQYCNPNSCPIAPIDCGKQHISIGPVGKIVGGTSSSRGEWPWQVGLYLSRKDKYPICGGTIISANIVVTAAHCFPYERPMYVRVGDTDLLTKERQEEMLFTARVVIPKKYERATKRHDIAIIFLNKELTLKDQVFPACLPEKADTFSSCTVTGWGRLESGGRRPNLLQKAEVLLVENKICEAAYKKALNTSSNPILPGMICAGYADGGADSCQGDSGGPLVCEKNGRYYLKGITSWGLGCGEKEQYGVYTNTWQYMKWIKHISSSQKPVAEVSEFNFSE